MGHGFVRSINFLDIAGPRPSAVVCPKKAWFLPAGKWNWTIREQFGFLLAATKHGPVFAIDCNCGNDVSTANVSE
jgi:hypothetical protein